MLPGLADAIQSHKRILQICMNSLGADSPLTRRILEELDHLNVANEAPKA